MCNIPHIFRSALRLSKQPEPLKSVHLKHVLESICSVAHIGIASWATRTPYEVVAEHRCPCSPYCITEPKGRGQISAALDSQETQRPANKRNTLPNYMGHIMKNRAISYYKRKFILGLYQKKHGNLCSTTASHGVLIPHNAHGVYNSV